MLPLGISFFIFQKIAYLVDAYRGEIRAGGFLSFALFVSFFPQLIAGPIVHHSEVIPQFGQKSTYRPNLDNISMGIGIFVLGLAKKTVLADTIATYATPVFRAAQAGADPTLFEAWGGALAYTFQLYFDFAGYSDMAIGLALMFNIRLPINFNSPYKATNIIDFWRRWHITLSRFLRDYLYIPLGGNRHGVCAALRQPHAHHAAGRPLARRRLDLHRLGRPPWHLSRDQPLLARAQAPARPRPQALDLARAGHRADHHLPRRDGGLGVLPRRGLRCGHPDPGRHGRPQRRPAAGLVPWPVRPARARARGARLGVPGHRRLPFRRHEPDGSSDRLGAIAFLLPNSQSGRAIVAPNAAASRAAEPTLTERIVAWLPLWRPTLACGSLMGAVLCYCLLAAFAETPSEFLYFQF